MNPRSLPMLTNPGVHCSTKTYFNLQVCVQYQHLALKIYCRCLELRLLTRCKHYLIRHLTLAWFGEIIKVNKNVLKCKLWYFFSKLGFLVMAMLVFLMSQIIEILKLSTDLQLVRKPVSTNPLDFSWKE